MVSIYSIYSSTSNLIQSIYMNMDMLEIIKLLDNNIVSITKTIIYDLVNKQITNLNDNYAYEASYTENDSYDITILNYNTKVLESFACIKDNLNLKSFNNFIYENNIFKNKSLIFCNKYNIYGYIVMNDYETKFETIKQYTDEQFVIFLKKFYSDYLTDIISEFLNDYKSLLKLENIRVENNEIVTDVKQIISQLKEYIINCQKMYNEDIIQLNG